MIEFLIVTRTTDEGDAPFEIALFKGDLKQFQGKWVGTILELGVSTYADTLEDLRKEVTDALMLQLNEVERLGYIRDYLDENNVQLFKLPPMSKNQPSKEWELVVSGV